MIEYFVAAFLVFVIWVVLACVVKPKRLMKHYVRQLEAKGFKCYVMPYKVFRAPWIEKIFADGEKGNAIQIYQKEYLHYDVIVCNYLNKIMLDFTTIEAIKQYFSNENHYYYSKGQAYIGPIVRCFGRGVVMSEGDSWKKKRKILHRVFNFQLLKNMTGMISEICDEAIRQREKATKYEADQYVDYKLFDLAAKIFSTVIIKGFLGGGDISEYLIQGEPVSIYATNLVNDLHDQIKEPLSILLGNKYLNLGVTAKHRDINRRIKAYQKWGQACVARKIALQKQRINNSSSASAKEPANIIEAIVLDSINEQSSYTEQQVFQEFGVFLIAGTDTTSHFFEIMIYMIALHPEVEKKVRAEIEEFMSGDDYSFDNLNNLKYIKNVQKETIRLRGPAPFLFAREIVKDHIFQGITLKKGTTMINPSQVSNHYKEQYYKDPLEFRPERWDGECDDVPAFFVGGFSAGPRSCIGKSLAFLESKIALVKFMKRYSHIDVPVKRYEDIRMELKLVYQAQQLPIKLKLQGDHIRSN